MKRVWKCDFCTKTDKDSDVILEHEKTCSFNPIMKNCFSCKHHDFYFESSICKIDLDVYDGEDDGNCKGWFPENINEWRKIKLKNLK